MNINIQYNEIKGIALIMRERFIKRQITLGQAEFKCAKLIQHGPKIFEPQDQKISGISSFPAKKWA